MGCDGTCAAKGVLILCEGRLLREPTGPSAVKLTARVTAVLRAGGHGGQILGGLATAIVRPFNADD